MGIGAEACELLVTPVLKRSVANFREAPRDWNDIPDTCAALLLEVGGVDDADLIAPLTFEKTVDGQRGAWHIRNGRLVLLVLTDIKEPPSLPKTSAFRQP